MKNKDLMELMKSMNKVESVRVVAKNIAKSLADQLNLPHSEANLKALEEAFVRGANWRLLQDKKKLEEAAAREFELEERIKGFEK